MAKLRIMRSIFTAVFIFAAVGEISAQKKTAVGVNLSYASLGVSADVFHDAKYFMSYDLNADFFDYRHFGSLHPGCFAAVSWNYYFARLQSSEGNEIVFYAGPGIMAGYLSDRRKTATYNGCALGMSANVGVQCRFNRNFALSLNVSPVLGAHFSIKENNLRMHYYREGITNMFIPKIGLKYLF